MILTLPLLSKYPAISFLLQDSLSLSNVAVHFKRFPHVVMKGIWLF